MAAAAKVKYKNRSNDLYVQSDLSNIGEVEAASWYYVFMFTLDLEKYLLALSNYHVRRSLDSSLVF